MALSELRYFSDALQKMTAAMVILPERSDLTGPFPVFYLLHGLSDDHTAWVRKSNVERHVQDMPLIVVMPDGGRGWYADAREGYAYDSAIAGELVGIVDRCFNTDHRREARGIGGLSMGGYGALRLAMAHPDLFCSVVSHSGVPAITHMPWDDEHDPSGELRRIFGPKPEGGPDDLFAMAAQLSRNMLPAMRIDCGTDDLLLGQNRAFHEHLNSLGIAHEYQEFPGGHEWSYWDEHVKEALAFHARNMGFAATAP